MKPVTQEIPANAPSKTVIKIARTKLVISDKRIRNEDEIVKVNGQQTVNQTTRLGLQIKFVDAETSQVIVGSGLGEAVTIKTTSILGDISDDVKFNQSTIGISTKKALETASSRVVKRLITKGVFPR